MRPPPPSPVGSPVAIEQRRVEPRGLLVENRELTETLIFQTRILEQFWGKLHTASGGLSESAPADFSQPGEIRLVPCAFGGSAQSGSVSSAWERQKTGCRGKPTSAHPHSLGMRINVEPIVADESEQRDAGAVRQVDRQTGWCRDRSKERQSTEIRLLHDFE